MLLIESQSLDPSINPARYDWIIKAFIKLLGFNAGSVTLLIASDAELKEFNQKFRKKNKPTDILSWTYTRHLNYIEGDIAVSADEVCRQALLYQRPFSIQLIRLLAHGCSHLAGFDHQNHSDYKLMHHTELKLLHFLKLGHLLSPHNPAP